MQFQIDGPPPDLTPQDELGTSNDIRRGDLVCFERVGSKKVRMRALDSTEVADYSGTLYRVDRGLEPGTIRLVAQAGGNRGPKT